jgi:hypothetical protein
MYWRAVGRQYGDLANVTAGGTFLRIWLDIAHGIVNPLTACQLMGPWSAGFVPAGMDELAAAARQAVIYVDTLDMVAMGMLTANSAPAMRDWLNGAAEPSAAVLAADLLAFQRQVRLGDLVAPHADHVALLTDLAGGFLQRLHASTNPARLVARDEGLVLQFETATPQAGFDQNVRGYALALCSFLPATATTWLPDKDRANWITNTAVLARQQATSAWIETAAGKPWWLHEAIGSTLQNGLRTTRVTYEGRPVAALLAASDGSVADAGDDTDGSDTFDFLWPGDVPGAALPLLGYGMYYSALCTCLDNAGGVTDARFRAQSFAELRPARLLFDGTSSPQWRYLSAVPPGAPVPVAVAAPKRPVPAEAFQWSRDTRAHAHAVWTNRHSADNSPGGNAVPVDAPQVALLLDHQIGKGYKQTGIATTLGPYHLSFAAPGASAAFIERWLNTDIALAEAGGGALGRVSDPAFSAHPALVAPFKVSLMADLAKPGTVSAYHPAVGALGVAVWFDEESVPSLYIHPLDRVRHDAGINALAALRPTLDAIIETGANNAVAKPGVGHPDLRIAIAPGSYARVRVFSLVDEVWFTGAHDQRFHPIDGVLGDFTPAFAGYRAFGPTEHFFETAPAWQPGTATNATLALELPGQRVAGKLAQDNAVVLNCHLPGTPAWIRGLYVQRHEWHWTGYPVRLPKEGELTDWLTSLEGVESYREACECELPTAFTAAGWTYGRTGNGDAALLSKALTAGTRPARYAVFTARPTLRFRDLLDDTALDGPLALEREVYAVGGILLGIGPRTWNERLPTPALRWAVPLTSTYAAYGNDDASDAGETAARRTASGNLLVFDDALRRTDQLTRLGGIGDTLEVDLLETRDSRFREIGTNPIFHAKLDKTDADELRLDVQPPFGLTQDIGANPLVRQTAVIVSPVGGQGKWLLAKVRTRRVILPETLLDSVAATPLLEHFPFRAEGNDGVPLDFALDFNQVPTADAEPLVTLDIDGTTKVRSAWPPLPAADMSAPLRLVLSWHKGRWKDGGDPAWRLQVLVQRRKDKELAWTTVDKLSPFDNPDSALRSGTTIRGIALKPTAQGAPEVKIVRMSDYTDPMWLTFIGTFGNASVGRADEYRLAGDTAGLVLKPATTAPMPTLKGIDGTDSCFQILLLYRPLADVTRGDDRLDTGALIGAYCYSQAANGFLPIANNLQGQAAATLDGCFAYLCSVQRINAPSPSVPVDPIIDFNHFIQMLFNDDPSRESTMRILPEFIGPIPAASH